MDSPLELLLKSVPWETYRQELVDGFNIAVESFEAVNEPEPIYSISIWTDPYTFLSAVSFDTPSNSEEKIIKANEYRLQQVIYWEEKKNPRLVKLWSKLLDRSRNPADFKYRNLVEISHPDLEQLAAMVDDDSWDEMVVYEFLVPQLKEVRKTILLSKILKRMKLHPECEFGINSDKNWFDHVLRFKAAVKKQDSQNPPAA